MRTKSSAIIGNACLFILMFTLILNMSFPVFHNAAQKVVFKASDIKFFESSRLPDDILKSILFQRSGKKSQTEHKKSGKNIFSSENMQAALSRISVSRTDKQQLNIKNGLQNAHIQTLSAAKEIHYPLKIPFIRSFIYIIIMMAFISNTLQRTIPLSYFNRI